VTPSSGSGKAIIDRCMTDESILETEILQELPDDHRPDDEWIAAKLRVDHEFKKRMAAGVQRKFKRNFQGGMGTGYTTSDEVWCHFKPTEEQLDNWINTENRGENRIDEQAAMRGDQGDAANDAADVSHMGNDGIQADKTTSLNDADEEQRHKDVSAVTASRNDEGGQGAHQNHLSKTSEDKTSENVTGARPTNVSADTAGDASNGAPQDTWLGMLPALRDGPQQA
jgi:platelet-activating factor acetylhydrolase